MRGLISRLFVLALLVLVGFNAWQVSRLRREVADLKSEVASLRSRKDGKSSDMSGALSLMTDARKHAEQAKKHILSGDFDHAGRELDASLRLMQRAGEDAGARYGDALEKAERTLRDTRVTIERLWRKLDKKPEKAKGG